LYLLPAQVAELRNVSTRTLAREREAGNGPAFIKFGNKILYRRQTLLDWLAAHEVGSVAEAERRGRERARSQ
jgi:hypothetical protein